MRPALLPLIALMTGAMSACGAGAGAPKQNPIVETALDVWMRGEAALPESDEDLVHSTNKPFRDYDGRTAAFLKYPDVRPAQRFGCCLIIKPEECRIEEALEAADPAVQLRALVLLMRVRAPASVDQQWTTLASLSSGPLELEARPLLGRLRSQFEPEALDATLKEAPPEGTFAPPAYEWAVVAAGVTQHQTALPRLLAVALSDNLHAGLAAEASLELFQGSRANEFLAEVVSAWRGDVSERAADALLKRDRERLRIALLSVPDSAPDLRRRGVLLAELDDVRAVPILCSTLDQGWGARVDLKMLDDIERLATPEHLEIVEAVPGRLKGHLAARALKVVEAVRARTRSADPR